MKILHVVKKYPKATGGDAVVVANLERQQVFNGHEVRIVTSNCDEIQEKDSLYKFGLIDKPANLDKITFRRVISLIIVPFTVLKVIKKERPDIIHTHSVDLAAAISWVVKLYKIPTIHTFHILTSSPSNDFGGMRAKIELFLLRMAHPTKITVLDPNDATFLKDRKFPNTYYVPNGVNQSEWHMKRRASLHKPVTFIAVGRLEEQKGFDYAIKACQILKQSGRDFRLNIVGDGSQLDQLQSLIDDDGLTEEIKLMGRKSSKQLNELFRQSDIFILPSLWEGMPLSLLEAWAAGLPTIASRINSIPHIATGAAELVESANPKAIARAMVKLSDDSIHRKNLILQASKRIKGIYNWPAIIEQYYKDLAI